MEVRGAKTLEEVDQAYELVAQVFGPNYFEARAHKELVRKSEPLDDLRDAVVVVDNHDVVGFVRILNRHCYSPVGMLQVGGITSVCTHPKLRGQGWGKRVMEGALKRSIERRDDFSLLFSRHVVVGWYYALGYVGIGCKAEIKLNRFRENLPTPSSHVRTSNGAQAAYKEISAESYIDSYGDLPLTISRPPSFWDGLEDRMAQHRIDPNDFVNVLVAGEPIGYFIKKDGHIIEAASLRDCRNDFLTSLLYYCAATFSEAPVITLPPGHWCLDEVVSFGEQSPAKLYWNRSQMVRILDKAPFNKIGLQSSGPNEKQNAEKLYLDSETASHEGARRLLSGIVAQDPDLPIGNPGDTLPPSPGPDRLLLPHLPYWSSLDEL